MKWQGEWRIGRPGPPLCCEWLEILTWGLVLPLKSSGQEFGQAPHHVKAHRSFTPKGFNLVWLQCFVYPAATGEKRTHGTNVVTVSQENACLPSNVQVSKHQKRQQWEDGLGTSKFMIFFLGASTPAIFFIFFSRWHHVVALSSTF